MTANVAVRSLAEADVREATRWYEGKQNGLGAKFILELDALYERIARAPQQFPEIERGIRRALLHRFPYAVYFIAGDDELVILAVLHQHRQPDAWRARE